MGPNAAVAAVVAATAALLAHLNLPTARVAPVLWALALLSARRGGAGAVAAVCGVVVAPVVGALWPRGLSVACLGALAVGLWPLAVFGLVRVGRAAVGTSLAAAAHLALDVLGDRSGLPVRPPSATAETVLYWPEIWPLVRAVGSSGIDVLLVGASVAGLWGAARVWECRRRAAALGRRGCAAVASLVAISAAVTLAVGGGDAAGEQGVAGASTVLRVGVVAPLGRPREARLTAVSLAARRRELRALLARTESLVAAGADLVVWPENGFGGGVVPSVEAVAGAPLGDATALVAGDLYRHGESVAALAAVAGGKTVALREKTRAVPGVEAPSRGRDLVALRVAGRSVVPLLCYESIWRSELRRAGELGDLVVVQSDATSFAHTSVPRLHWRISAMLALERGLPLLFAAREGGVGLVDPVARRAWFRREEPDGPVEIRLLSDERGESGGDVGVPFG